MHIHFVSHSPEGKPLEIRGMDPSPLFRFLKGRGTRFDLQGMRARMEGTRRRASKRMTFMWGA